MLASQRINLAEGACRAVSDKKAGWRDPQYPDQCEHCGIRTGKPLPEMKSWDGFWYRICPDCLNEAKHCAKSVNLRKPKERAAP
jgi:hypothetical protein